MWEITNSQVHGVTCAVGLVIHAYTIGLLIVDTPPPFSPLIVRVHRRKRTDRFCFIAFLRFFCQFLLVEKKELKERKALIASYLGYPPHASKVLLGIAPVVLHS